MHSTASSRRQVLPRRRHNNQFENKQPAQGCGHHHDNEGRNRMKPVILASVLLGTLLTGTAFAQSLAPIKLANVAELSGGGATVGTNWKNGIDLAIEEINAKGGILGHKVEVTHADSQSNP